MERKINLRMIRDWLKDGSGAPTAAELLLEGLFAGEYTLDEIKADIEYNERLHHNASGLRKMHEIIRG